VRYSTSSYLVLLLGAVTPATLAAQADTVLAPLVAGSRVRVSTVASLRPIVGRVVASTHDSLVVRAEPSGDTASFAVAQLSRIELTAGTRRHRLRDAGLGFAYGAGIGTVLGLVTYRKPDCSAGGFCLDFGPGADAAVGAVVFGTLGTMIGLIIGSHSTETWVPVTKYSSQPIRVGIGPARDGQHIVAMTASAQF
jgi:hypothetical protein